MSGFNECIKEINGIMDNNIIRMYGVFDRHAFNYYNRHNVFSINGHEDEHMTPYTDDEDCKEPVIYRNTEDWFENEFLIFLKEHYYNVIKEVLITDQNMKYCGDLMDFISTGPIKLGFNSIDEILSFHYVIYYVNNLTFEDFKTLLYKNEIYNEVFMDDAVLK